MELDPDSLDRFTDAFAGGDFYVPPDEALLEELSRPGGGHFNVIHRDTALRADVYLAGDDPFHAWALEHRRRIEVEGLAIWLAALEYVIVRKLEYFRLSNSDRHLRDVAMMLRISATLVDAPLLGEWSERREVTGLLERARTHPAGVRTRAKASCADRASGPKLRQLKGSIFAGESSPAFIARRHVT